MTSWTEEKEAELGRLGHLYISLPTHLPTYLSRLCRPFHQFWWFNYCRFCALLQNSTRQTDSILDCTTSRTLLSGLLYVSGWGWQVVEPLLTISEGKCWGRFCLSVRDSQFLSFFSSSFSSLTILHTLCTDTDIRGFPFSPDNTFSARGLSSSAKHKYKQPACLWLKQHLKQHNVRRFIFLALLLGEITHFSCTNDVHRWSTHLSSEDMEKPWTGKFNNDSKSLILVAAHNHSRGVDADRATGQAGGGSMALIWVMCP